MTTALGAIVPTSDITDNLTIGHWYLVYTKARQESAAAQGLQDQGYPVSLPKLRQRRRMRRLPTDVTGALLPCYLFVPPGRTGKDLLMILLDPFGQRALT